METHISKERTQLFNPPSLHGYQSYIGMLGTTRNSGCGFYISNKVSFLPRFDLDTHYNGPDAEFEAMWIEVMIDNQNIIVSSIYRHPHKNDKSFKHYLKLSLQKIEKENKICIITGDFNYNLLTYSHSAPETEFLDLMLGNLFSPTIIYPSRITNNSKPSLIDNIFINQTDLEFCSGNLYSKLSDNMPNFIILKVYTKKVILSKLQGEIFLSTITTILSMIYKTSTYWIKSRQLKVQILNLSCFIVNSQD